MPAAAGEWLSCAKGQDGQPRAERTERHREATQSGRDDLAGKVDGSVMLHRCGEALGWPSLALWFIRLLHLSPSPIGHSRPPPNPLLRLVTAFLHCMSLCFGRSYTGERSCRNPHVSVV